MSIEVPEQDKLFDTSPLPPPSEAPADHNPEPEKLRDYPGLSTRLPRKEQGQVTDTYEARQSRVPHVEARPEDGANFPDQFTPDGHLRPEVIEQLAAYAASGSFDKGEKIKSEKAYLAYMESLGEARLPVGTHCWRCKSCRAIKEARKQTLEAERSVR